jgi:cyclopropane-fatty-acyl-phospholipid synthase
MSLYHAEDIGTHYARTLAAWRRRFHDRLGEVRSLGFDERFIRMWDYYLASCEGAFLERHVGDFQLLLTKNHSPRTLFGEPWGDGAFATEAPAKPRQLDDAAICAGPGGSESPM